MKAALPPALVCAIIGATLSSCAPGSTLRTTTLTRGSLAYAAAVDNDTIYIAALRTSFELFAYQRGSNELRWRIPLGVADYDITGVSVDESRGSVWVASTDATVRAFDVRNGAYRTGWRLDHSATALALNERYLLTGTRSGVMCLRRLEDGALLHCVVAHPAPITALAIDGGTLASAAADGSIATWQLPSLHRTGHTKISEPINAVALHKNRVAIATSNAPLKGSPRPPSSGRVLVWDAARGAQLVGHHDGAVTDVHWRTADELWSSSWDGSIRKWRARGGWSGQLVYRTSERIHALATHGDVLVTCSWPSGQSAPSSQVLLHSTGEQWE